MKLFVGVLLIVLIGCNKDDSYIQQARAFNGGTGNQNTCQYQQYSGTSGACNPGYVTVSANYCCPSNNPYFCYVSGLCYSTCNGAAAAGCTNTIVLGR